MGKLDFSQFINDFTVEDLVYLFETEFSDEHILEFLQKQNNEIINEILSIEDNKQSHALCYILKRFVSKKHLIEKICELDEVFKQRLMTDEEGYYKEAKSRLILKKFWTAEELEKYKVIGYKKFSKWGIERNEDLLELASNCLIFEQGYEKENNRKYYFHEDFYLAHIVKDNKIIWGIGKDPNKRKQFVANEE